MSAGGKSKVGLSYVLLAKKKQKPTIGIKNDMTLSQATLGERFGSNVSLPSSPSQQDNDTFGYGGGIESTADVELKLSFDDTRNPSVVEDTQTFSKHRSSSLPKFEPMPKKEKVMINLEDAVLQEMKLWNILETVRKSEEPHIQLFEEWWEVTENTSMM